MNKIRITENKLKQIVAESVKKVLNETFTFNDVDPIGDENYYNYYRHAFIDNVNDGEFDDEIKKMTPRELEYYVNDAYDYYGRRCGDILLKRALKLNKDYAMWGGRRNEVENNLTYNRYRSPNFYKGPAQYTDHGRIPLSIGRESLDDFVKYGTQDKYDERPSVHDVTIFPLNPTKRKKDLKRLYDYSDKQYEKEKYDDIDRGGYDWKIKHDYNGRNPDKEKLHTKDSANRNLRTIDKQRKNNK